GGSGRYLFLRSPKRERMQTKGRCHQALSSTAGMVYAYHFPTLILEHHGGGSTSIQVQSCPYMQGQQDGCGFRIRRTNAVAWLPAVDCHHIQIPSIPR